MNPECTNMKIFDYLHSRNKISGMDAKSKLWGKLEFLHFKVSKVSNRNSYSVLLARLCLIPVCQVCIWKIKLTLGKPKIIRCHNSLQSLGSACCRWSLSFVICFLPDKLYCQFHLMCRMSTLGSLDNQWCLNHLWLIEQHWSHLVRCFH